MLDWNLPSQAALDLPRVANMNGSTELEDKGDLPARQTPCASSAIKYKSAGMKAA